MLSISGEPSSIPGIKWEWKSTPIADKSTGGNFDSFVNIFLKKLNVRGLGFEVNVELQASNYLTNC